jgi:DNA polymerase III alpha subunit (gram-positive type)
MGDELLHIFSDIETDSFRANKLLQIAAITETELTFNVFIDPQGPLQLSTTNFLGLYYYKGSLYRQGLRLKTVPVHQALTDFMNWINQMKQPVILIFHNGFNFDCSVLIRHLVDFKIPIPTNLVKVGDTLPFFRDVIKTPEIENHKLSSLAEHFKINQEMAHCALSDSITLKSICESYTKKTNTTLPDIFKNWTRPFQDYVNKKTHNTPLPKLKKRSDDAERKGLKM